MSSTREIVDGQGRGNRLAVDNEGLIGIVMHPHPPKTDAVQGIPLFQYFTDNGTSSGGNDMVVNASAASPQDFWVGARAEADTFIARMVVRIGDAGAELDEFGALPSLTNGLQLIYSSNQTGELVLVDSIQTNLDFFSIASGGMGFGNEGNAWRADVKGGEDTYFPIIDFEEVCKMPYGLRLRAASNDKVMFRVRDNLSGITTFNILATGRYDIF